ncbi:MAG TPA: photosynthetic reaction center cytochrome c subunit family protein [Rugosimonospora sp.]|nr:photosynthetic reaction center cytochrome c subunit family protein [Rugosimonospora sp.]
MLQAVAVCLLVVALANGQTAPQEKPLMAEDVFKNIQVLRGLTVDQFMGTMGFIAAALSMNCSECHHTGSAAEYAEDTPRKQTARKMILMVNALNKSNFGGKREVTCYSCHRSDARPKITPSLAEQYGTPPPDDPDEVEISAAPAAGAPSADQVLNKYIQALGGAQRLASVTSFAGKGTYEGFDTEGDKFPVEVYAKAPNERTTIVHLRAGDNIRTCDGRNAWNTSAGTLLPIPVFSLSGGDLEGAMIDAGVSFPGQIKQLLKDWRTGFPSTTIDDKDVDVVQGSSPDNTPVKFYFDKKSGLLLRQVRYTDTALGLNPTQIDYDDYRDVSGVKMPFRLTTTWTDGRSTIVFSELRANVSIDAAKFSKPTGNTPQKP